MTGPHPSHNTRASDASTFDEVCTLCGATDISGGGWGKLAEPCAGPPGHTDLMISPEAIDAELANLSDADRSVIAGETPGEAREETDRTRIERIKRQMLQHGGVDSDDMEWMADHVAATLAPSSGQNAEAWLHVLHMEHGQTSAEVTLKAEHPFGRVGEDFDPSYIVTSDRLYRGAPATDGESERLRAEVKKLFAECEETERECDRIGIERNEQRIRAEAAEAALAARPAVEHDRAAEEGQTPYGKAVERYVAAIRMIREAVGELFGPLASLESEEAVLLRGPEPVHDAEAIIDALKRLVPAAEHARAIERIQKAAKHGDPDLSWHQQRLAILRECEAAIGKPGR